MASGGPLSPDGLAQGELKGQREQRIGTEGKSLEGGARYGESLGPVSRGPWARPGAEAEVLIPTHLRAMAGRIQVEEGSLCPKASHTCSLVGFPLFSPAASATNALCCLGQGAVCVWVTKD